MTILKNILLTLLLTTGMFSITGCSGGEANYSLEDLLNLNLVKGSAEFDIPNHYIIEENTTAVTTIEITAGGKYTFIIAGGSDGSMFMVDPNSGQLSLRSKAHYNDGGENTYDVVVGVQESGELSTFTIIVEVVKNIKKTAPIIDYAVERVDTVISNDVITQIKARPADINSNLVFTLDVDSNTTFEIDSEGKITMRQPLPDFATLPQKEFSVYVNVTDSYGNTAVAGPIVITLLENRDLIRPVVMTKEIFVIENSLGTTQIKTNSTGTGVIDKYLLDGVDKTLFTLSSTGVLEFKEAKDYETDPDQYVITVQTGDDKGNLSDIQAITIYISDLDEHFTFEGIDNFTPMEGEKLVGSVKATSNVLKEIAPQYSLVQGGDKLEIDQDGKIQFKESAVKGDVILVQVLAQSDLVGSASYSSEFSVLVQDDPSKIVPEFNDYSRDVTIENEIDGSVVLTTVTATPQGTSTSVAYAVVGVDSNMLYIAENGQINLTNGTGNYARQDANNDNVYEFSVVATDNNGNSRTSDLIKITLIVDESILFDDVPNFTVDEDDAARVYATLHAVSNQNYLPITYGVKPGYDTSVLTTLEVDANSGELTVAGNNSSFLSNKTRTITLYAKDAYGNESTQTVDITVTN